MCVRKQSTTGSALLATCQFAICAQDSKGMKKQAVGKQENVFLFELADQNDQVLIYHILFTACWDRLRGHFGRPKFSSAHVKFDINLAPPKMVWNWYWI